MTGNEDSRLGGLFADYYYHFYNLRWSLITDPRSSLTEKLRNEIESKGVQFPGRGAPDKINKGG